jgi:hypothetical protein
VAGETRHILYGSILKQTNEQNKKAITSYEDVAKGFQY